MSRDSKGVDHKKIKWKIVSGRNTFKGPEAGTCLRALRRESRSVCPEKLDWWGEQSER